MLPDWHDLGRAAHIASGFGGLALGLAATLLPKFGRASARHRWAGRAYAVCMIVMAGLSVPLAYRAGNVGLFVTGVLTLAAVVLGWLAIRAVRGGASNRKLIARHVILMGASYAAAWTAFFVTNPVFGHGTVWHTLAYAFVPGTVATALITRSVRKLHRPAASVPTGVSP